MPFVEKFPLKDGGSVSLHTRPSHDQNKAAFKVHRKNVQNGEPEESIVDFILLFCTEWEVKGEDGEPIPLTKAGVGSAEQSVINEVEALINEHTGDKLTVVDRLMQILDKLPDDDPARAKVEALAAELAGN